MWIFLKPLTPGDDDLHVSKLDHFGVHDELSKCVDSYLSNRFYGRAQIFYAMFWNTNGDRFRLIFFLFNAFINDVSYPLLCKYRGFFSSNFFYLCLVSVLKKMSLAKFHLRFC